MGLGEYEEFAYQAMGLNENDPVRYWEEKRRVQERLKERLDAAREVRIVGPETDVTMSVENRELFLRFSGILAEISRINKQFNDLN